MDCYQGKFLKRYFLATACFLMIGASRTSSGETIEATSVQIYLYPNSIDGSYSKKIAGGYFYNGKETMSGEIRVFNADQNTIRCYPVNVRSRSFGPIVAGLTYQFNGSITLTNLNKKPVKALLGSYWGISLGATLGFGGDGYLAMNKDRVILGDIETSLGVALDIFGVPQITIYPNVEPGNSSPSPCTSQGNWDDIIAI